ncbi:MAG: bifunctional 4'-phosphopantothenoylcysteine decarboxylase/phosphopantothenoylcysteine synthetase, partial [bacterium]
WFAPSMNVHMWENSIVQENVARLKKFGYHVMEPESGDLACGYEGKGRLPELDVIVKTIESSIK